MARYLGEEGLELGPGTKVPVGLFGLAMKTTRVCGSIAAAMASRSWPKFFAATSMPRAPRALVASG